MLTTGLFGLVADEPPFFDSKTTYQRRMEDLGLFDYDMSATETQQNWKWDVEIVYADSLLWRSVFQMGMGQEIRGAL